MRDAKPIALCERLSAEASVCVSACASGLLRRKKVLIRRGQRSSSSDKAACEQQRGSATVDAPRFDLLHLLPLSNELLYLYLIRLRFQRNRDIVAPMRTPCSTTTCNVTDSPNGCVIRAIAQHDRTAEYRQNALDRHGRFARSCRSRPRSHRFPGCGCHPACLAGVDRVDRFLGLVGDNMSSTSGAGSAASRACSSC